MENLNTFDRLLNYPIENKLEYETHRSEKRFFIVPSDPILNTKYIAFKKQNLSFVLMICMLPNLVQHKLSPVFIALFA